jgi:anti-sigma regulatory factor (Ser/Thr protein kinase)
MVRLTAPRPRYDLLVESLRVPSDRSAAARARHFVEDKLGVWGIGGATLEDCRLLVSELVTNAVVHAHSPAVISMEHSAHLLTVSVCDESMAEPSLRQCAPTDIAGRGLMLVDRLASRWGVETENGGKRVWFELRPATTR